MINVYCNETSYAKSEIEKKKINRNSASIKRRCGLSRRSSSNRRANRRAKLPNSTPGTPRLRSYITRHGISHRAMTRRWFSL